MDMNKQQEQKNQAIIIVSCLAIYLRKFPDAGPRQVQSVFSTMNYDILPLYEKAVDSIKDIEDVDISKVTVAELQTQVDTSICMYLACSF